MTLRIFRNSLQKGSAIITVIIFLTLIGIFVAALWPYLDPIGRYYRAQDLQRESDLAKIQQSLEAYYRDRGRYPASSPLGKENPYRLVVPNSRDPLVWGEKWPLYMDTLPKDPNGNKTYVYYSPPDSLGQTYYLYASLDMPEREPKVCNKGKACDSILLYSIDENQCGGICNYAVSSSNVAP